MSCICLINSCVLLISEFRYYQRKYEPLQYQEWERYRGYYIDWPYSVQYILLCYFSNIANGLATHSIFPCLAAKWRAVWFSSFLKSQCSNLSFSVSSLSTSSFSAAVVLSPHTRCKRCSRYSCRCVVRSYRWEWIMKYSLTNFNIHAWYMTYAKGNELR